VVGGGAHERLKSHKISSLIEPSPVLDLDRNPLGADSEHKINLGSVGPSREMREGEARKMQQMLPTALSAMWPANVQRASSCNSAGTSGTTSCNQQARRAWSTKQIFDGPRLRFSLSSAGGTHLSSSDMSNNRR
jgi:hypothetical protein